jgi:LysR family transcriptional activator of nhaA
MEWINYHHLLYFWSVVRAGTITRAAEQIRVSPPAISSQLRQLEATLGEKLFERVGRRLELTEVGTTVFAYADDIFTLGREMVDTVRNRPPGRAIRVDIGVVDVLPKLIAQWLIEPALKLKYQVRLVCREATADQLVARLGTHELDVVLSDSPLDPNLKIRAYSHLLGECGVTFVATADLAAKMKKSFPTSLHAFPMLLPTDNMAFRRSLDYWFETQDIQPNVVGEFEDYALLRAYGQAGTGVFPVPTVFESHLRKQDRLKRIGATAEVELRFYAISGDRKIKHPAVVAICNTARRDLFGS